MKCICGADIGEKKTFGKLSVEIPTNWGIEPYNKLQKELHSDIQDLITTKYIELGADECMTVFARVYSSYVLAVLKKEGKVLIVEPKKNEEP